LFLFKAWQFSLAKSMMCKESIAGGVHVEAQVGEDEFVSGLSFQDPKTMHVDQG
jgi:hypothetical protein